MRATGIRNLDRLLGGGLDEGDLILVVGPPGSGKTTLGFQMAFHVAEEGNLAVYVSTLSEPAAQLLRHLRAFAFWKDEAIGQRLFLESVFPVVRQGVDKLREALVSSVRSKGARLLILDGLTTIRDLLPPSVEMRLFVHQLAAALAPLGCTCLVTSSDIPNMRSSTAPEITMCDGVLELAHDDAELCAQRTMRVWKMRGAANLLGRHAFTIASDGIRVHPRFETLPFPAEAVHRSEETGRLSIGNEALDTMMSGGLPRGTATIVAGGPGTGKTLIALQFLTEGAARGEKGVLVCFRDSVDQLVAKARSFHLDLEGALTAGLVRIIRRPPVHLQIDELLLGIWDEVEGIGAGRLAIDSAVELEEAIPAHRRRSVLAFLVESLRRRGATTLLTREISQLVGRELDFSQSPLSILAENVLLLRHAELDSALVRMVTVLKMRDAAHDHSIRRYDIDDAGFRVRPRDGALGATGTNKSQVTGPTDEAPTDSERAAATGSTERSGRRP
jgi:circadian clock protein KaiC